MTTEANLSSSRNWSSMRYKTNLGIGTYIACTKAKLINNESRLSITAMSSESLTSPSMSSSISAPRSITSKDLSSYGADSAFFLGGNKVPSGTTNELCTIFAVDNKIANNGIVFEVSAAGILSTSVGDITFNNKIHLESFSISLYENKDEISLSLNQQLLKNSIQNPQITVSENMFDIEGRYITVQYSNINKKNPATETVNGKTVQPLVVNGNMSNGLSYQLNTWMRAQGKDFDFSKSKACIVAKSTDQSTINTSIRLSASSASKWYGEKSYQAQITNTPQEHCIDLSTDGTRYSSVNSVSIFPMPEIGKEVLIYDMYIKNPPSIQ